MKKLAILSVLVLFAGCTREESLHYGSVWFQGIIKNSISADALRELDRFAISDTDVVDVSEIRDPDTFRRPSRGQTYWRRPQRFRSAFKMTPREIEIDDHQWDVLQKSLAGQRWEEYNPSPR